MLDLGECRLVVGERLLVLGRLRRRIDVGERIVAPALLLIRLVVIGAIRFGLRVGARLTLRRAAHGSESLALGALDFRRIRPAAPLEI